MSQLIYNDLKQIIKEVVGASQPAGIVEGIVLSVDPIRISLDKNTEPIPSSLVSVPQHLNPNYKHLYQCPAYPERICGFNPIKVGDTVYMVRGDGGQRFIVLGKSI